MAQQGLLSNFALDLGFQVAGWAVACLIRSERYYDITGSLTFLTLAARSLLAAGGAAAHPRSLALSAAVGVWAARLGTFLAARIHRDGGRDSRFDTVRSSPPKFLVFWLIQGVWVFLTSLPLLLLNGQSGPLQPSLRWTDLAGASPWDAAAHTPPLHSRPALRCPRLARRGAAGW